MTSYTYIVEYAILSLPKDASERKKWLGIISRKDIAITPRLNYNILHYNM